MGGNAIEMPSLPIPADGCARTAGKVGVVISTSGPGATKLVTGSVRVVRKNYENRA